MVHAGHANVTSYFHPSTTVPYLHYRADLLPSLRVRLAGLCFVSLGLFIGTPSGIEEDAKR